MKNDFEVITFKADTELVKAMEGVTNRSAFIRQAILTALDSTCPLCSGTGVLTAGQRNHWEEFTSGHHLEKCGECEEIHLVCDAR